MSARITVIDYGVGNLYSVRRAIEVSGGDEIVVSSEPADIDRAERLILPGVGAFRDGMRGLRERQLVEPLVAYARSGRPLLGICLGMQMLATGSEEFGQHAGLGLVAGKVVSIPRRGRDGAPLKVPFIGWTSLTIARSGADASGLASLDADSSVYLVHSFHFVPDDPANLLATYDFAGNPVTAAIRQGNITGFQFHPEKSGSVGLAIMSRFLAGP